MPRRRKAERETDYFVDYPNGWVPPKVEKGSGPPITHEELQRMCEDAMHLEPGSLSPEKVRERRQREERRHLAALASRPREDNF